MTAELSSVLGSVTAGDREAELARNLVAVLADVMEIDGDEVDVSAHFFDELGADSLTVAHLCARLQDYDKLPNVSIRQVYQHPRGVELAAALLPTLPAVESDDAGGVEGNGGKGGGSVTAGDREAELARNLVAVLADVMEIDGDEVDVSAHFFDELGADSLTVAHLCARLQDYDELPRASIKQVYQHPRGVELAAALLPTLPAVEPDGTVNGTGEGTGDGPHDGVDSAGGAVPTVNVVEDVEVPTRDHRVVDAAPPVGRWYWRTGLMQLVLAVELIVLSSFIFSRVYDWVSASTGPVAHYGRSVASGALVFVGLTVIPILIKRVLLGRWKRCRIRIWGPSYFAFWTMRILLRASPMRIFVGSPLYGLYLRALGARVGRGTVILSPIDPVCADLLTIGDNTVIRKDSQLNCYRAIAGWIEIGPVTIGRNALIGEMTVLDIDTSVGDDAQVGHMSALSPGQSVPDGERWIGVSAHRTTSVDLADVEPLDRGARRRRILYPLFQLTVLFGVTLPLAVAVAMAVAEWQIRHAAELGPDAFQATSWTFQREVLIFSAVVFAALVAIRFLVATTVPRLLSRFVEPGTIYPMYSHRYGCHRLIQRFTNNRFLNRLFGDSSYILHYLRAIGYRVSFEEQTGAAFGQSVKHDNPYVVEVGPGTMVADGLSIINVDYSATSFRIEPVSIGTHSFFGNRIGYPSRARTGDNCLHGSKVLVPLTGEERTGVGFLGSPSFEIPRSVDRDSALREPTDDRGLPARLPAKNRHNLVSMAGFLVTRWVAMVGAVALWLGAFDFYDRYWWSTAVMATTAIPGALFYYALVERASRRFRPLPVVSCSIYDKPSLQVERYWKLNLEFRVFTGTPLRPLVWRLLGVRIGRRVFDDGCTITERNLATVGDHCTLNTGSVIQTHSLEDGAYKSDHTAVGARCTLGVGAMVHYGVTMGDRSTVGANAFLMKGTTTAPGSHWAENPAREVAADVIDLRDTIGDRVGSITPAATAVTENMRNSQRKVPLP